MPLLWLAIASGGTLIALELYPSAHWAHQVCALFVYAKLGALCLVPFLWEQRVPLLLGALVVASVGAHAPRTRAPLFALVPSRHGRLTTTASSSGTRSARRPGS